MNYYMGIDMGGTMVKVAIFNKHGKEVAIGEHRLKKIYPNKNMVERDIKKTKSILYEVIAETIKKSGISSDKILGIGVTGQANGLYMLDENGEPVRNAVLSSDTRARKYVKRWIEDGTWKSILPKIRQQIWAGNVSALIAWFQDNEPESLEKASFIITAKDYVRYLLTGKIAVEITEATAIASMDQDEGKITKEIFGKLNIERWIDKIPKTILNCQEISGGVTEKCALFTGLKSGTPVVGGQMDTGACIIAAGVTEEDQLGIVVGSWGINSIIKHGPIVDENIFMVHRYCIPGTYCITEGSATSATNLEWFISNFIEDTESLGVYNLCDNMVKEADYRDKVIFLPFLFGSNVGMEATSAFVGLEARHGKKEMLRAIYEGVAFCHKHHIEKLKKHIESIGVVRMAGGAARSEVWMQIFSDILNLPIEVSEASELGAMGVAMHAAVATGEFKDIKEVVADWIKIKRVYYPDPIKAEFYQEKYKVYKKVICGLDEAWKQLDKLG